MIDISNLSVYGFEEAIRGMRNPKNSWDRSDSDYRPILASKCDDCELFKKCEFDACNECETHKILTSNPDGYLVGPNDLDLMKRLARGGPVHAKYRRYITVYVDINAPLYFWKEFDTYRVGVCPNPTDIEFNSCSTMHKIDAKEFTVDDFAHEHLFDEDNNGASIMALDALRHTILVLNAARDLYLRTKDKRYWWQMIQTLPSSYIQKRTVKLNYEVLSNMYEFRKNHKLDEWRELMEYFEEYCPYSEIFTSGFNRDKADFAVKMALNAMKNDIYGMLIDFEDENCDITIKRKELEMNLENILNTYLSNQYSIR